MKKWNIILPLFAFLFAVVAAFATTMSSEKSPTTFYYRDITANRCEACDVGPINPSQCDIENQGPACKCTLEGNVMVDAGIDPAETDCEVVRLPKP